LHERRSRHIKRDVLHAANFSWRGSSGFLARLVSKDGEQAAISGIEVQVILIRFTKIRLLKDERHPQRPLPEVQGAFLGRPDEGDVMNALHL